MESSKQVFFRVMAVAVIFGVGTFVGALIQSGVDTRAQAAQTAALPFTVEHQNDGSYIVSVKDDETPAQLMIFPGSEFTRVSGWATCNIGQHYDTLTMVDTRPRAECNANENDGSRRFGGS